MYPPAKLEHPGEEGGAEGDLSGEEEVGLVDGLRLGLFAEVVDDAVHGILVAQELHRCTLAVEHAERFLAEIRDVPALGFLYCGVLQELWCFTDPVHAESGDLLMLVGPADHVIAVAVPGQGIGAEDVGLPVVL